MFLLFFFSQILLFLDYTGQKWLLPIGMLFCCWFDIIVDLFLWYLYTYWFTFYKLAPSTVWCKLRHCWEILEFKGKWGKGTPGGPKKNAKTSRGRTNVDDTKTFSKRWRKCLGLLIQVTLRFNRFSHAIFAHESRARQLKQYGYLFLIFRQGRRRGRRHRRWIPPGSKPQHVALRHALSCPQVPRHDVALYSIHAIWF